MPRLAWHKAYWASAAWLACFSSWVALCEWPLSYDVMGYGSLVGLGLGAWALSTLRRQWSSLPAVRRWVLLLIGTVCFGVALAALVEVASLA